MPTLRNALAALGSALIPKAGIYDPKAKILGGLVPAGIGDVVGSAYIDRARKQRQPTRVELLMEFRNAVYRCANLNGEACAAVPLKLYVQTRKGEPRPKCRVKAVTDREQIRIRSSSAVSGRVAGDADVDEVPAHPALELLANPNPWMSWHYLAKGISVYNDLLGNYYIWADIRNRLRMPRSLWMLPAHLMFPYRQSPGARSDGTADLVDYYLFTSYRTQYQIPTEEVIHGKMFNPWDPYTSGMGTLQTIWEFVNVAEKMLAHTQAALDNRARPDALVTPAELIGQYEADRLEKKLNLKFRSAGYGGIMVAESAVKVEELQWSPADLQALEVYAVSKDLVYDAYEVPQAFGTKETNLANLQASLQQHARFAVKPRCVARDEVLNRSLLPMYDPEGSGRLFFASDNPVPEDQQAMANKTVAYVNAGIKKRSEARSEDGLPPESWADKPILPGSHQVLGDDGNPQSPPEPPGGNNDDRGSGVRSGGKNGKPTAGAQGGQGGAKDRPQGKAEGGKGEGGSGGGRKRKALVRESCRLSKAVRRGRMGRHAACLSLCRVFGVSGEEADALIETPAVEREEERLLKAFAEAEGSGDLDTAAKLIEPPEIAQQ